MTAELIFLVFSYRSMAAKSSGTLNKLQKTMVISFLEPSTTVLATMNQRIKSSPTYYNQGILMQDNGSKIQQRNGFKTDYAPDWPMKAPKHAYI